jgi:hypothetical protein
MILPVLTGCSLGEQCPEFAAPQSRQGTASCSTLWSRTGERLDTITDSKSADAAARAVPVIPTSYCYRTLAATECFSEPQPGRPNFSGTYP